MKSLFGVYCTDGIARNGEAFAVSALEDMIWQGADGRPLGVSHDFHRFAGWSVITGLYMSHEMSYVVGNSFIPEDVHEMDDMMALRRKYFFSYWEQASKPYRESFVSLLRENNLIFSNGKWIYNGILMYGVTGIINKAFPFLTTMIDDDGLILIDELIKEFHYVGQGIFSHNKSDLTVLLHPYFRRSYSHYNNYNFGFIDMLWQMYNQGNKTIKVLLDQDFIGFAPSFKESREYEYWYGPKYDDDIVSIPEGVTRYENDKNNKAFNNVKSTEFIWQKKDDGRCYQFEMEEVTDVAMPVSSDDIYGCRYLHALYDIEKGLFNHFDGAVRCYDFELMFERLETPINKIGHRANYQKVFRIDGVIPIDVWKSLTTQYLCSNELVYDYFGISRPFAAEESSNLLDEDLNLQRYVPYPINKGDGVRILVSYLNETSIDALSDREFLLVDKTTLEDGQESLIAEFATLEVFKVLKRVGAQIKIPNGIVYYLSEDSYNYIPRIHHTGNHLELEVNKTLLALRLLVDTHVEHGDDEIYSFSLSWPIEDKTISLSFMGHVADLQEWLYSFDAIPVDRKGIKQWMISQNQYVHRHGRDSLNPVYSNHIKSDGVLFFQRHDIKEHVFIQNMSYEDGKGLICSLSIDGDNEYLYDQLKSGNIRYVPKYIIYDAIDLNTGESYLNSSESAVFRETKYQLENFRVVGFNWAIGTKDNSATETL